MVYRYEWVWEWHAWQRFTRIDTSALIREMEKKAREKVTQQKAVQQIESITSAITKEWNEWVMGIYHNHVNGVTRTVFTSTVAASSPLTGFEEAVIIGAIIAVILIILAVIVTSISSAVRALGAGAPILAAGAGVFLLVIGLMLLPKAVPAVKKVYPEIKKAIPVVKKEVRELIHA